MGQYQVSNRLAFARLKETLRTLSEADYRRTIRRLSRAKLVSVKRNGEVDELSLLSRGTSLAVSRSLGVEPIQRPRRPGSTRYLVAFDIPERTRARRKLFRDGLVALGLEQVQLSLFAHTAPCAKAVRRLATILGIERHVKIFEAEPVT